MTLETEVYQILKKHKLSLKKREELIVDLLDFINKREKAITVTPCCTELPTKETVISEGEKQIVDWLEENDQCEKQAYRIGFRRSFEYVLRLMNK